MMHSDIRELKGRPQILLVDDDTPIRKLLARSLQRAGFEVTEAADGRQAQELIELNESSPFNLVVSDLQMPRVGGVELLSWVTKTRPQLPVVIVSGSLDTIGTERIRASRAAAILAKPFTVEELREVIERVLAGSTRASSNQFVAAKR